MPKRLPRARTLKGDPKLAYYDSAGGVAGEPVILLLHQSLARSEDWENIFPRLATRYRTIAYDARGHGKSGRASEYTLRAFADDALRVLREIAKAPAVLIGHSLGALTALIAASDAPDLVRAIVLEDPPIPYPKAWDPARYGQLRDALGAGDVAALAKAVAKQPLPSAGPSPTVSARAVHREHRAVPPQAARQLVGRAGHQVGRQMELADVSVADVAPTFVDSNTVADLQLGPAVRRSGSEPCAAHFAEFQPLPVKKIELKAIHQWHSAL